MLEVKMSLYNIAFDTNNKTECLNHFSIEKKKGFIFESVNRCEIRPIGSILLDFLNIDIENDDIWLTLLLVTVLRIYYSN